MIGYLLALLRPAKPPRAPSPPPTRENLERLAADSFAAKEVMAAAKSSAARALKWERTNPVGVVEAEARLIRAEQTYKAANSRYLAAVREYATALADGRIKLPEDQP